MTAVLQGGAGVSAFAQGAARATAVRLLLPHGVAFDHAGGLYVTDERGNRIYRISSSGDISIYAGTGEAGFGGDGGPAVASQLNAPSGLALDAADNLVFADSGNHLVRRVERATGLISTVAGTGGPGKGAAGVLATRASLNEPSEVAFGAAGAVYFIDSRNFRICRVDPATHLLSVIAGNGVQGTPVDGAPALSTPLNIPTSLAIDPAETLYFADRAERRVYRVEHATGLIHLVAGTGVPASTGDGASALKAAIRAPAGLALDAANNLFISSAGEHRVRRVDAASGVISTVAGDGVQAFAGDGGPAIAASLSRPTGLALSPAGLLTIADAGNQRVRQIDAVGVIHTVAGLGVTDAGSMTLTGASISLYGTGTITAVVGGAAASGQVNLIDTAGGRLATVGTQPLSGSAAVFTTNALAAGVHRLQATYAGDLLHAPAVSSLFALTVRPANLEAVPQSYSLLYGQPVPALAGALSGVLAQDQGQVTLLLTTTAAAQSAPGAYPVTAAIGGASAGNYTLSSTPASVTILQAPSAISLNASVAAAVAHVATTTSGTPGGAVQLSDGSNVLQASPLNAASDASFVLGNLSNGSHTLTARYIGDRNFLPVTSAPAIVVVDPGNGADFTLAATGQTILNVPPGSPAVYSFAVSPLNGGLSSSIQLSVAGAPAGAMVSFSPAYLPPGGTLTAFLMTVQVPQTALLAPSSEQKKMRWPSLLALLLPLGWLAGRRRGAGVLRILLPAAAVCAALLATTGCGDRINALSGLGGKAARTYAMTVTGTATSASGAVIQHSANVTLVVP